MVFSFIKLKFLRFKILKANMNIYKFITLIFCMLLDKKVTIKKFQVQYTRFDINL